MWAPGDCKASCPWQIWKGTAPCECRTARAELGFTGPETYTIWGAFTKKEKKNYKLKMPIATPTHPAGVMEEMEVGARRQ